MALGLNLSSDLLDFLTTPPMGEPACAERWATIIRSYTSFIVPAVDPATQDLAKLAFQAALTGMSANGAGLAVFDLAFAAYASALAAAMPPSPGTPPPAPLSLTLTPVSVANKTSTKAVAVSAIAVAIDVWFRTGLSSTATPWS